MSTLTDGMVHIVATYLPSSMAEHIKSESTQHTVRPPEPTLLPLSQSHLLPGVVGALDGLPQVDLPGGLALEALVRRVALPEALDQARRSRDLMQPRVSESVLLQNFARHERTPFKCKSFATLQSTVLGLSLYFEKPRRRGYDIPRKFG